MITAKVIYVTVNVGQMIQVIDQNNNVLHKIQYGGGDGDGYCYHHQDFDCVITVEEKQAIYSATITDDVEVL